MEASPKKLFKFSNRKSNRFQENITPKYIPQELVEKVLFKLPAKSLLRFRSVSKKWKELITNLKSYIKRPLFLLGCSTKENEYVFWADIDGEFQEYARHEVTVPVEDEFNFNCCGNGLICFSDYGQHAVLWNPSIRRSLILPKSDVKLKDNRRCAFGIVVDHVTNEYKVLRADFNEDGISMEIYRQSSQIWELIDCKAPFAAIYEYQVDLKGISYWIAVDFDDDGKFIPILVSFDGHAELFGSMKINVPNPGGEDYYNFWYECDKCLFLFEESQVFVHSVINEEDPDVDNGQFKFTYKVWKMHISEGKSWNLWSTISFNKHMNPMGFRKNGEFLWAGGFCYVFITLENGFTRRLYKVNVAIKNHRRGICSFPNYVESLALLEAAENNGKHPDDPEEVLQIWQKMVAKIMHFD